MPDLLLKRLKKRLHLATYKASSVLDQYRSQNVDIQNIKTVCLMLGPYRNLSTLTASLLALHPACQVLNHAGKRIFTNRDLNFFRHYQRETFDNFVQFALYISTSGKNGPFGGSITHSHAFEHSKMQKAYHARFANSLEKPDPTCLFWKESLGVANHLRHFDFDFNKVFESNEQLRFLMPVRHPLDCAASNKKKIDFLGMFEGLTNDASIEDLIEAILKELRWVLDLHQQYPDRFFIYFQNKFNRNTVQSLGRFLQLEPDEQWEQTVLDCFDIKSGYEHPPGLVELYKKLVEDMFSPYPDAQSHLLDFVS